MPHIVLSITRSLIMERVSSLVGHHQKAFVQGRRMGDHITEVLEHFYMDRNERRSANYVLVDFTKAFDRIDRGALSAIMRSQGWSESYKYCRGTQFRRISAAHLWPLLLDNCDGTGCTTRMPDESGALRPRHWPWISWRLGFRPGYLQMTSFCA